MADFVRLGRRLRFLALSAPLTLGAAEAAAQAGTISSARVITLSAAQPGQLTVSLTSGLVQTIPAVVDNAVNSFPGPATIVTQWNVNPGQTGSVNLIAYFSLPTQALAGGAVQIPSSRILGRMTTGIPVAFTRINQNGIGVVGTAGGSLHLFAQNITGVNKNSSRTDNLDLQLDLVGFPTLPTGSYTGTLNLRAITQ
jgi:hypothetical protein